MQGEWVWFLIRELGSYLLSGVAKKLKRNFFCKDTKLISFTEIELFFLLSFFLLLLFDKHSPDCCKSLGNFQSSEKFDSDHFASLLLLLWKREFPEILAPRFCSCHLDKEFELAYFVRMENIWLKQHGVLLKIQLMKSMKRNNHLINLYGKTYFPTISFSFLNLL